MQGDQGNSAIVLLLEAIRDSPTVLKFIFWQEGLIQQLPVSQIALLAGLIGISSAMPQVGALVSTVCRVPPDINWVAGQVRALDVE